MLREVMVLLIMDVMAEQLTAHRAKCVMLQMVVRQRTMRKNHEIQHQADLRYELIRFHPLAKIAKIVRKTKGKLTNFGHDYSPNTVHNCAVNASRLQFRP